MTAFVRRHKLGLHRLQWWGVQPGRSRQNLYETDRLGSRVAIDCDS